MQLIPVSRKITNTTAHETCIKHYATILVGAMFMFQHTSKRKSQNEE